MAKILVIEDTQSLREGIVQSLNCLGFEAIGAENGKTGIQLAKMHFPDLIVCDIMMPEVDGYQVYKILHQDSETMVIPFIFLSAKTDRSDIRKGMNLGADDYLAKPFTTAELTDAITSRLHKKYTIVDPYIAEMKKATDQISALAYQDALTKLPNRILLYQKFKQALETAKRRQQMMAVLYVNICQFKAVNDTFGHFTGDLLLQAVAERLTKSLGEDDIAARINADVFSMILVNVLDRKSVEDQVKAILNSLANPYWLNDHKILVQANIGIALYPNDQSDFGKLLSQAEMAMGFAKRSQKDSYYFYQMEMGAKTEQNSLIEKGLNVALENSEFQIFYQPKINLITGRIMGAEALLRWHHPELGMVDPNVFIPIAEEKGHIIEIGNWILETVCTQTQIWQDLHPIPLKVSVNLSAFQLRQEGLVQTVTQILDRTRLDPNCLELELTETSLMEDIESAIAILEELKAVGIKISLDDFGTGYSSLNYLKRLPLDTLKIDRSFINDVFQAPQNATIVTTIIAMARGLKLRVIAEGVETQEQFDFLREQGCQAMQGYLFSPAVPAEQFEAFLVEDKRL
ncbi:EAL domain-containing protein [Nodosilinea sp. LEGE 07298]|uniref:EAL domain-containing response regulator n=1 Tax=Nodosilinea sp. LEGE 07298 TaxID=2777970 RepID=UPI00187DE1EA|nr:EAL domain-containing response regulator [Nodosilinea sp. LEGE 07298]MBE9109982.1 EAL domain-containing protein [Nodosilinea sp. LEGE 07298]